MLSPYIDLEQRLRSAMHDEQKGHHYSSVTADDYDQASARDEKSMVIQA